MVEPKKKRALKGEIALHVDKGWLRLRWNHQGKRYVMAMGLVDTPGNRALAEAKGAVIRADILSQQFDKSLVKYRYEASDSLTVVERIKSLLIGSVAKSQNGLSTNTLV
ncbi:MAG: DUF3596 domain-containing protein [Cyanobacteria bacterium P01_D01_bin.2]